MPVIEKQIKVADSGDALMQSIVKVTKVVKEVTKDGWQTGTDLPPVLSVALMELVASVQSATKLPDDAKAHTVELIRGLSVGVVDVVEAIIA